MENNEKMAHISTKLSLFENQKTFLLTYTVLKSPVKTRDLERRVTEDVSVLNTIIIN